MNTAQSRSKSPAKRTYSYLEHLQFDPAMLKGFVAMYLGNIRLVLLLIISIALLGTIAFLEMPKRLNPEVNIPIVTIVTVLPGAGPADVESLVTTPIEDELRSLTGVDVIASNSLENVSTIAIQFLSSVDGDEAKNDVQNRVDSVTNLPSDAQSPSVALLDFEDYPVWTFALITTKSYPDLMSTSRELREVILDVPQVGRVVTNGLDQQEILVEVSAQQLANYNLNPFTLSQLIRQARASYPAGTVTTSTSTFALTIDPSVESIEDIRNLPLSVNNQVLKLGELANISLRSTANQNYSFIATAEESAKSSVTFSVYKTTTADIDDAGEAVDVVVNEFMAQTGDEYQLVTLSNTSDDVNKQFTDLLGEFRTTILLVMGVLFLFLGLRQAIISSLTVPLTFLSAFFLMQFFGMSINFLSLFAFLLALGLLVDDTIVVVSSMTSYYKSGRFTPMQTGLLVWKDTIVPIWSTTITTIWSFVPLLITSGIIGEFIKPIPVVVTVTMLSSTAIAVLITLPLMIVLLKPNIPFRVQVLLKILAFIAALGVVVFLTNQSPLMPIAIIIFILLSIVLRLVLPVLRQEITFKKLLKKSSKKTSSPLIATIQNKAQQAADFFQQRSDQSIINLDHFSNWYRQKILNILKSKSSRRAVMIGVIGYSIFGFALLPLGFVKNEFFPKSDTDIFYVELKLPPGTVSNTTQTEALTLLEELRHTPHTEFVTADIGQGVQGGFGGTSAGSNIASFSIRLIDVDERSVPSFEIAEDLRNKLANYEGGSISIIEQSGGPPAGADLQIKLLGNELGELNTQADQIVQFLNEQPGVTNVNKSVSEGTSKVVFVPDPSKVTAAGLTTDTIGGTLRLYASGFTLDTMQLTPGSTEETDVVFRLDHGLADVNDLSMLQVTTNQGKSFPLVSLGHFATKANPTSIDHEDFQRTISVSAAVRSGYVITEENTKLETFADTLDLPDGYVWQTGGLNEENARSITSVLQAMALSTILILITMVVQFGSFRQALIVIIVIPLAVSSVFLAYALTGTAVSFPAIIGILSLFGIVVTNSMFIVDKINLNQKEGMGFEEAIADAGASRMEPIILTKLSTILGLLPITIADPLWRGLGGAIISGLLAASTIMLLFIPVLYYSWMKVDKKK